MVDLYRVRTNLVGGTGSDQVSTMFFGMGAGETAQDAATAVSNFWYAARSQISNQYTMEVQPEVFTIDQATGEPTGIEAVFSSTTTGASAADPLPWMTQGLVRWTTGVFLGGHQIRGRTFIPAPTEDTNVDGVPNALYLSTLKTAADSILSTSGVTLLVYSRAHHTSFAVVADSIWSKWAELRSRRD